MTPAEQRVEAYLQFIEKHGVLNGRFSNVRRINATGGGGTFSFVFFADDMLTGKEVALKFFNPDRYTPANVYRWESFQRESRVLATLKGSRDIVDLVCGQDEFLVSPVPNNPFELRFAYYALEKADGNLEDAIASGTLTAQEILIVFRAVTRAVQRIHSKEITHRDLKPGNFLICADEIKLSDFGTARSINDKEPAILAVYSDPPGDQRYSAPEMMACLHDVDPRFAFTGDFFSLGAILFECFTGMNLGVQLFGAPLLIGLTTPMAAVSRDQRAAIFDQIIGSISAKFPLPTIERFNPGIPSCIRERINKLFAELCALDYRARMTSFSAIFRGIDTCLLILRNEAKYLAWQREKQKRRVARQNKMNGVIS